MKSVETYKLIKQLQEENFFKSMQFYNNNIILVL